MTNGDQLLVHGGDIFTASGSAPWVDALVVQGDRIVGVGTFEALVSRFPDAASLDVEGRTVLPGLIDAHNHFLATGESLSSVDLRYPSVSSVDDVVRQLGPDDAFALDANVVHSERYGAEGAVLWAARRNASGTAAQ